jgi:hypothetical protein
MSDKDPKKRLTRAEKRAMNKAAFAKRDAAAKAEKAAKAAKAKPNPDDIMNSPMAKFLPPVEETGPDPDPPLRERGRGRAREGAGAKDEKTLIGEILVEAAGFIPEEPASPATVRYDAVDHEPTEETRAVVMALKLAGQTDDDIALYLKISDRLLRRHYLVELEEAVARAGGEIALKVTKLAMAGDPKIVRWFAERRLPGFSSRPSVVAGVSVSTSAPQEGGVRGGVRQIVPPPPNERGHLEVRMILGIGDKDIL